MEVQRTDLAGFAVPFVIFRNAEFLDAVPVGGGVAHLRPVVTVRSLPHDLRAGTALRSDLARIRVKSEAILNDDSHVESVRMFRLIERPPERVA